MKLSYRPLNRDCEKLDDEECQPCWGKVDVDYDIRFLCEGHSGWPYMPPHETPIHLMLGMMLPHHTVPGTVVTDMETLLKHMARLRILDEKTPTDHLEHCSVTWTNMALQRIYERHKPEPTP